MADKTSGLFLLYAITMALFHRERTGEGQQVQVPMFECMVSFLMNEHMQARTFEPPQGAAGYQRMLTPHRRPYATADGYICVLPYNNRHWQPHWASRTGCRRALRAAIGAFETH